MMASWTFMVRSTELQVIRKLRYAFKALRLEANALQRIW